MIDRTHILKDAGLVAADATAKVDGDAKIVNLGAGLVEGNLIVDVTALEVASNDEIYVIALQGSSSATFASDIETLAILELGAAEVVGAGQDSEVGRYTVPFRNEKNGTIYPYVRVYTDVDGEIATGINFSAYLTK